jgi:putative membrane protein
MTTTSKTSAPRIHTPPSIIWSILAVSAAASLFIFWLVYVHPPIDAGGNHLNFLPALNAVCNAFSTVALLAGFRFIVKRKVRQHRAAMFTAFFFSTLFLVSYLTNYALHGEYHLPIAHTGALWTSYLLLLISHITLSVIALPMILITFFFSLSERFPQHRAIARWTFPIWLYVSVTGVAVFLMQAAIRG